MSANKTVTVTVTVKTEHASGGRQSWWKHITATDASQRGGYAFAGEFLRDGEYEFPVGALLLHVTHQGSAKSGYQVGNLYAVDADGQLREIAAGLNWREQSVSLRKAADEYLSLPPVEPAAGVLVGISNDDLLAEVRRRGLSL